MTESSMAPGKNPAPEQQSTVIVLGVDTPIGVAILRDLGRHGHYTVGVGRSKSSIGFASRFCHRNIIRAKPEQQLIDQLQALAEEFPGAALIAISEHDHLLLNRHRNRLEQCLRVLTPAQEMLDQVLDKARSLELAQQAGIRIPDTFTPRSQEEVEQRAEGLTYPRVIKWADPNKVVRELEQAGLTLHKCQYAHNAQDLIEKLRPYASISEFPLVQEYCPGQGIGQMFLVRDGEVILRFQHQRIHEWPPEGGVSSLCKSLPVDAHQACLERSTALLGALRWNGVAMVEYRHDPASNSYYFMEINGRFWGSLPLAMAAGVPFAAALVGSEPGGPTSVSQPDYTPRHCRFMIPELRRLARLMFQPDAIQDPFFRYSKAQELADFIRYFFYPGMRYYIFDIRDPGPFLADLKNILTKLLPGRS
jgi:predicted ATP-grasp superfamily ATP-dependent carboligase